MKRLIAVITIFILMISTTACGRDALKVYKDARQKTSDIKQGHSIYDISIENEYNIDGLSEEEVKQLNYFKEAESKMDIVFKEDGEKTKLISRNYFNLGGLGFDSAFYKDNENMYIKMPMLGKYVVIDESMKSQMESDEKQIKDNSQEFFMEKLITTISQKWVEVLNEKDVVTGKKTLLSTEDGEVKTTEFSITPTEEQVKILIEETLIILFKDEQFKEFIKEFMIVDLGTNENEDENTEQIEIEEMLRNLKNSLENISISDFKYTGYIDIDGYISQENISFKIYNKSPKAGTFIMSDVNLQIKTLGIEKEQIFDFPEINENNTLDIENINQGMPFMLEGLFDKKEGSEK